jgi:protein-disulfide isomerase
VRQRKRRRRSRPDGEGQSLGVTGTPSFVINGRLLVGAQPVDAFKAVIDDELASAK